MGKKTTSYKEKNCNKQYYTWKRQSLKNTCKRISFLFILFILLLRVSHKNVMYAFQKFFFFSLCEKIMVACECLKTHHCCSKLNETKKCIFSSMTKELA